IGLEARLRRPHDSRMADPQHPEQKPSGPNAAKPKPAVTPHATAAPRNEHAGATTSETSAASQVEPAPVPSGSGTLRVLAMLWPYIRGFPVRMTIAAALLVIAKMATVYVPIAFRDIVNRLDPRIAALTVPIALIALYGVLRLIGAVFGQLRDTVFERVSQRAMRASGLDAFRHLHQLSLRFHLDRHTGGVGRDISRGTRGVYNLLGWVVFNIVPTIFEIAVVIAFMLHALDWRYAIITLAT